VIRDVHPGSGSRIQMLIYYPSRIPDPEAKIVTGSRIWITVFEVLNLILIRIQILESNPGFESGFESGFETYCRPDRELKQRFRIRKTGNALRKGISVFRHLNDFFTQRITFFLITIYGIYRKLLF
jgi:hypothetical protein